MQRVVEIVFALDVTILAALLAGTVWSVAYPARRLWPPQQAGSRAHRAAWMSFYLVFGLNAALLILDWNSWIFASNLRFVPGIPLVLMGTALLAWGIRSLGRRNTFGIRDRFVNSGPYVFTRNPQYLGDVILFWGLSLIANSLFLWITHFLTMLVFAVTPLAEEIWLEEQYGEEYARYKRETPRFL